MYRHTWILLFCFIITACSNSQQLAELPQDKFIQAYFNHRDNSRVYTDPYRSLERSGDNLEEVIIEEIVAATSTIDLAVQELNLPLIARALVESHRSGVRVRVILDNNYSRSLSELNPQEVKRLKQRDRLKYEQFLQLVDLDRDGYLSPSEIAQRDALTMLRRAGIPVIDDTADGSKGSGLMHHKFMIVDGQTVVTGSANFTISGIHGDINNLATRGNVNHLLKIENTAVANLFTEEFNYMWGDGGKNSKFGLAKPWRSPKTITWENTEVVLQFAPTSKSKDWRLSTNGAISKAIDSAANSIDLALFVFSEQEIVDILQQKHQQGVKISGVFDAGFAYRYYSEVLDMLGVTLYLRCKAETNNNPWTKPINTVGIAKLPPGDKLHHKFSLIDDRQVISGSQNWSETANHNNDEALIIINNLTVAKHFQQEFQRLYSSSVLGISPKVVQQLRQQQNCN